MSLCSNASFAPVLNSHIDYLRHEIPLGAAETKRSEMDEIKKSNLKAANLIAGISFGTLVNIYGGVSQCVCRYAYNL